MAAHMLQLAGSVSNVHRPKRHHRHYALLDDVLPVSYVCLWEHSMGGVSTPSLQHWHASVHVVDTFGSALAICHKFACICILNIPWVCCSSTRGWLRKISWFVLLFEVATCLDSSLRCADKAREV